MRRILWFLGVVNLVWTWNIADVPPRPVLRIVWRDRDDKCHVFDICRHELTGTPIFQMWQPYKPFNKPVIGSGSAYKFWRQPKSTTFS